MVLSNVDQRLSNVDEPKAKMFTVIQFKIQIRLVSLLDLILKLHGQDSGFILN